MLSRAILTWLETILGERPQKITLLAGDGSFRRYYRVYRKSGNALILMDNPPSNGSNASFIAVAKDLEQRGVKVPERIAANERLGTLLLSDMGDTVLLHALNQKTESTLYQKALHTIHSMQKEQLGSDRLPVFDKSFMMMEMDYLPKWLLNTLLKISLSNKEQQQLQAAFEFIAEAVAQQPYVFIHRDYHSRNIMLLPDGVLGVLDFQDAMMGPLTYDAVSLLRDCYYVMSPAKFSLLLQYYHQQCSVEGVAFQQLEEWFHVTTIQRHVKVAGIFARLACRDGKKQFIHDIPAALYYLVSLLPRYTALHFLQSLIEERIVPALKEA